MTSRNTSHAVEIAVSDRAELRSLRAHLERVQGIVVRQRSATPSAHELGGWDVLEVLGASGGALVVAIQTIPTFIRSRRSDIEITVKTKGKTITITATNVDGATAILEKALDV